MDVTERLGPSITGRVFLIPSSLKAGEIARVLREGYDMGLLSDGFQELVSGLRVAPAWTAQTGRLAVAIKAHAHVNPPPAQAVLHLLSESLFVPLHDLWQPRDDLAVPMIDGSHLDDDRHRFVPTFRSTVSCHAPDHDVRFPSHGHRGFNRHSGHFGERAVQICLPCNSN